MGSVVQATPHQSCPSTPHPTEIPPGEQRGKEGPWPTCHPARRPGRRAAAPRAPRSRRHAAWAEKQPGKVTECFSSETPAAQERRLVRNAIPRAARTHRFPTFLFIGNDPFDTFT